MDDPVLIESYKLFREEAHKSIELHATHFRNFLTLIIAISAATLAGAQHYLAEYYKLGLVLLAGGCFGIVAAHFGRKLCDRFYEGMLEAITVTAKLEEILGLNDRYKANETVKKDSAVFPKDDNLIPERWLKNRKGYKTSLEFINAHMNKGSNNMVRRAFRIFSIIYGGVFVGGLLAELMSIFMK